MIRLTFATDAMRVVGDSTPEGNARRFERLPPALHRVMPALYAAPNVLVGGRSAALAAVPELRDSASFVLTRDAEAGSPADLPQAVVCSDYLELVRRFRDSEEELNVIGGRDTLRMFLHHADRIDVAQMDEPVPGDLVFDEWVTAGFELETVDDWDGGRTLRGQRPSGPLARNKRNAMGLYDVMFNWNRPKEAAEMYLGAEYIQHNPHVGDGPGPFIEYFERMAAEYPDKRVRFLRALAEGDQVALHCHQIWPGDDEYAGIDLFRFDADGRIVEHWDVLQVLPESSANPNGMF